MQICSTFPDKRSPTGKPGFPILKDTETGTAPHLHFLTLARRNNHKEKKQEATRPPAFSCKPAPSLLKILCPAGHQRAQKILWIFDCPYKTIYPPLLKVSIMLQCWPVGGLLAMAYEHLTLSTTKIAGGFSNPPAIYILFGCAIKSSIFTPRAKEILYSDISETW